MIALFGGQLEPFCRCPVVAGNPLAYARPKPAHTVEFFWAERERSRYKRPQQIRFLPEGEYKAEIALTEESLHSMENDGGWWATVYRCPVEFTIASGPTNAVTALSVEQE